jgi:hypothetical protein
MYIFCYKEPQLLVTRICHGDAQELQKSKSKHISGGQEAAKLGSIEHGTNVGEGAGRPSVGSTGTDGQGALRPRRSQQKFFHFPQHQRLFPSESRDASQRTRLSAESPPGDSVGFFYGLTPPDNQRFVRFCLCIRHESWLCPFTSLVSLCFVKTSIDWFHD